MRNIILEYPRSIKSSEYCFRVNTDDYFDPKPLTEHLNRKGISFKRSKTQSKTKCIGYHNFKLKAAKPIQSFEENINFCEDLFKDFPPNK